MIAVLAAAWPHATASAQTESPTPTQPQSDDQWGESSPPENYVRSKEPAKDGQAYNWTQMAYAGGFMACMGLFIVWLIRRNQREPDAK